MHHVWRMQCVTDCNITTRCDLYRDITWCEADIDSVRVITWCDAYRDIRQCEADIDSIWVITRYNF